ncbi:glycosyltransferase [Paracoccus fontiphilus]|uniref:Glycosyltransferase n=1 Tax=Paracoccus fontiphilus TaxID=1815556 RepID=A0ABV7ILD1_9RHOB|nr:glycosyltransferase [Paracoccus fontiphilus]
MDDFINDPQIEFVKVPPIENSGIWHTRKSKLTSKREWFSHFRQSLRASRKRPDGIIACFPQLAMCSAFVKKITRSNVRIIAYNFNLGALRLGRRRAAIRFVADQIECFVVHSPAEVESYTSYLGVPKDKVKFIPLQRGKVDIARIEDFDDPYVIAMGSAGRDYETLIKAVDSLGIRTIIVTRPDIVEALPSSSNVTFMSSLTPEECMQLLSRARISVTPISNQETASGQVTFLNAMQLGVPSIATRCPGTDGYFDDGETGLLVAPGDEVDMKLAILSLWEDVSRRQGLALKAKERFHHSFSDQAAAERLQQIIESA